MRIVTKEETTLLLLLLISCTIPNTLRDRALVNRLCRKKVKRITKTKFKVQVPFTI